MKNANRFIENLRGKMKVADLPRYQCSLGWSLEMNFINRLRQLPNDIIISHLVKYHNAVGKPGFKIEAKLGSIIRNATPAAFKELATLGS